eukprot:TRINITY_DN22561_c0_g1_i1.p1 TRINITY_DN22561_c0_g1~~TRINITY_DN22561_c0_g1_i1.p1  ORF type:complete len:280 (+),score=47.47 TRINITY_DN22561_c0_g1_i1:40-879(+)
MNTYPEELIEKPVPVVALLRGQRLHPVFFKHLSTFATPNGERQAFHILNMNKGEVFPKRKYNATTPKPLVPPTQILSLTWIHKHLRLIPSVAVLFLREYSDIKKWRAKENQIYSLIETTKQELTSRGIKLLLVLVTPEHPEADDDRLSVLKKRTDLDNKRISLFNVSGPESSVRDSVARLERAILELADLYYREQAQHVKKEKERQNVKHSMKELFIRYCWKQGFFTEFRNDKHTAIKHYREGFKTILELVVSPNGNTGTLSEGKKRDCEELRLVAEFF